MGWYADSDTNIEYRNVWAWKRSKGLAGGEGEIKGLSPSSVLPLLFSPPITPGARLVRGQQEKEIHIPTFNGHWCPSYQGDLHPQVIPHSDQLRFCISGRKKWATGYRCRVSLTGISLCLLKPATVLPP